MAYALVAHTAKEGNTSTVTSTGINTTGATLIVVSVSYNPNPLPPQSMTFSDNQSNPWNLVMSPGAGTTQGGTRNCSLFWIANPTTNASHTFTVTGTTSSFPSVAIAAFSGVVTPPEKITSNTVTSGTSVAPGSITPAHNNALVVTGLCLATSVTATINGSFSITDQIGGSAADYVALAYLIQTSAAAANPTWSFTSANGASVMLSFPLGSSSSAAGGSYGFA